MSQIMHKSSILLRRHVLKGSSLVAMVVLLAACSHDPQPQMYSALQAAETAIADADRNGVNGYPSPELVEARNKLQQARVALEKEEMPLAMFLAQESEVDAELASAKSTLIKEQQVNAEIEKGIDALKQEMDRNVGAGS
ncbi:DUF4398 domain-containing protein [Marinomonas sp.]|uniref:DUF4398 domain-containing protein n=1 Tax=Marinomonas sp. TaxID=1904862 RepID=UPI003BAAFBEC